MRIRAFSPLRPSNNAAADALACPPYDVISQSEAQQQLADNPTSFLSVIRPDATHPLLPPADPALYAAARDALQAHVDAGRLVREDHDSLYVYQLRCADGHSQTGLVTLVAVEDYDRGLIKRHEVTRRVKEDDRFQLADTVSANTGPVFLAYRDRAVVDAAIDAITKSEEPLFDVGRSESGQTVTHLIWRVQQPDTDKLVRLFSDVPSAYIADGHHRAASAARVCRRRAATPDHPSSSFLAVLFAQSQLRILPYNRVFGPLPDGMDEHELLRRVEGAVREIAPLPGMPHSHPARAGMVYMAVGAEGAVEGDTAGDAKTGTDVQWFVLTLNASGGDDAADRLDCGVLQRCVLGPVLGVKDVRADPRLDFVAGASGLRALHDRVADGPARVAFGMHPVLMTQLLEVSDAGLVMPPKSTWFHPKLASGFFIQTLPTV